MKLFSVVAAIVCVLFISEKAYGALPICSATLECTGVTNAYCAAAGQLCQCNNTYHLNVEASGCIADIQPGVTCANTTECVNNATCKNATGVTTMQCTCDAGFHTMSGACALDIQLGGNCTSHGDDTECADNAVCVNVTGAPSPVCTCKPGFHNTSGACVIDVQLGGNCTSHGDETECGDNAVCVNVTGAPSLVCTCKPGFHNTSGACVIDIQLGGNCTSHGDDTECADNAMCVNVTGAPSPVCTCKPGFHNTSGACVIDIGAGGVCTVDKANTECVDHATCKNSQPTPGLKCTCDEDYHPANSSTGNVPCAADTCQDSVNKCKAAGMNSCTEVVTYVQCLLTGVCQSGDVQHVNVTKQSLQDAREKIPAGCAVTNITTCLGKVSSCFIDHLKQEMNCTTIGTLETCLGPTASECIVGVDAKVQALANAYMTRMTDTYSCKCIKAISSCSTPPQTTLENATAEASAKCSAVTELFKCAMPSECNATRTIDNRELSAARAKAMKAATENQCKDAIPEADATTCPLQLIRCSLIYGQAIRNATDKMITCRAAEALGTCLANKTGLCTDAATKNPFTTQYEFIKATCTCENLVNLCKDKAGVVPTDPNVVCPKMQNFSLCVMEARCDLTQKDNALHTAFRWYSNHTATYNCPTPKDKSCQSDLAVCADEAITSMSTKDASAASLCRASQSSVLCVNAANCNQSIASHMNLVSPFTNGTLFRMAGLSCQAPQCTKVYKDFTDCKNAYTSAFTAAGADDTKKCTAKNDMVKCIRGPRCNPYLKAMVDAEYQNLLKVAVNNCDMLSLTESNSGASTSFNSLLPALVSVLIGYLVVKM